MVHVGEVDDVAGVVLIAVGRNLGGVAQIDEPGSLYETALGAMPDAETEGEGRVYSA